MRKIFIRMLKPVLKRNARRLIEDQRVELVTKINQRLDIPNVDEKKEKEYLDAMYGILQELVLDVIEEI